MIRILIVDDQELMREGMAAILAVQEGLFVVGQAANGKEACAAVVELKPDLVLMDIRMPVMDGIDATQQIRQDCPATKVILLTTFDEEEYVVRGLALGASGYILKNTPTDQLTQAIKAVHSGNSWLAPSAMARVAANLSSSKSARQSQPNNSACLAILTERERDVLKLLKVGKTNREIAECLHLSEGTVRNHITRILDEIGAKHRTEAAVWAQTNLPD